MLQCGEYGTLAELADAERINRSYVSRILTLTLLAPTSSNGFSTAGRRSAWRTCSGHSQSSGRGSAITSRDRRRSACLDRVRDT
jgi:hypothetical protein